ncbi:hypothetical protein HELRODRAFT_164904 [Helobdella robusta]|uniref:Uncharacterized protein n=1 Tax=Helobdella robusta TaxID=6412 RepID=T1EVY2_HELRO|nr:hypothetical protein HELRODRAFT_164904 [Helobdella robusta]ESN92788.1 hypothetical protein HELRODRAFT_164904 [Helobdella robusta]
MDKNGEMIAQLVVLLAVLNLQKVEPSKTEINILKNSRWGDAPLTPSAGNVADIFWPVEPMKKRHRPATPTLNQVNIETKSSVKGIVGRKPPLNLVIAAKKAVTKKKFYHIGNVARCTKDNIVEYLKSLDVETVSCFPVFKKSDKETKTPVLKKDGNEENLSTDETKPTSSDKSTSFRLCVDVKLANVIEDMDSWPEHVIANSFNKYFTNLVDGINVDVNDRNVTQYLNNPVSSSVSLCETNEFEVLNIVHGLRILILLVMMEYLISS